MSRKISDFFQRIPKDNTKKIDVNNNSLSCNSSYTKIIPANKSKTNSKCELPEDIENIEPHHDNIISKKIIDLPKKRLKPTIDSDDENDKLKGCKRLRIDNDSDEEINQLSEDQIKPNLTSIISTPTKTENSPPSKAATPKVKEFLSQFSKNTNEQIEASNLPLPGSDSTLDNTTFDHDNFNFLKPECIRDKENRKPDHPDYDCTTLKVPEDFMNKLSPGMKQWWILKMNGHMDTVLFFKVGKFYETYHKDAVICVKELGLSYMRGTYAHSGFPESAFIKMADQLVLKGYKVARVEQTETVEAMNKRISEKTGSRQKVVNREICQVLTPGTRSFSLYNGICRQLEMSNDNDGAIINDRIDLLYAFKECVIDTNNFSNRSGATDGNYTVEIGVVFVNISTGKFTLTQFLDDKHRTKLKTIFSQFPPSEIIYEKRNLSTDTQNVFNTNLAAVKKEGLVGKKQFYDSDETLKMLLENDYFTETPIDKLSEYRLPIGLTKALNTNDNLGRTASPQYNLAINSLGGLLYYMGKCLIDKYLVSFASFELYDFDWMKTNFTNLTNSNTINLKYMILDSVTMTNLDLLKNSSTGTTEGTLLERLDMTSTAFGRRLLIQWISNPLVATNDIRKRQEAISELLAHENKLESVKLKLKSLPDLEKLLAKIHILSVRKVVENHPDSRAVLYENASYSKRKILDFIATLNGFKIVIEIQSIFEEMVENGLIKSELLKCLMQSFPGIKEHLKYFDRAFNHDAAKTEGKIIPYEGIDPDYDSAVAELDTVNLELEKYRESQSRLLRCNVKYVGSGRNRCQMEIPQSADNKVPQDYTLTSQRKGFKRYQSEESQQLLSDLTNAETKLETASHFIMTKIFSKFNEYYKLWSGVLQNITEIDVLFAFSLFSKGLDGCNVVKPEFADLGQSKSGVNPYLSIVEGKYPCKTKSDSGEFIPNSINLGSDEAHKPIMLLTGPNMGGKSTLMRQVALTVILAQLGCRVPSDGPIKLTSVDRILTRQGAQDNLSRGQSTLQVELTEAKHVLNDMTPNSLLLIDELGRGTSTHDGCALACSILYWMVDSVGFQPRCLFSTHFHRLLEDKHLLTRLQVAHMACVVDEDDVNTDNTTQLQNITFLYKLIGGGCPKSYGFNAAKLANVPEKIIISGLNKAREFEQETLVTEFKRFLISAPRKMVKKDELILWQNKFRKVFRQS